MSADKMLRSLVAYGSIAAFSAAYAAGGDATACLNSRESAAQTIAFCTSAIRIAGLPDTQHSAFLTQRGLARLSAGDLDRGGEDFEAALRLDNRSSWAYNSRAVYRMQKGETDRAITDYERAVELKPDYAFAWANLAHARLVGGHVDRALSDFDRALALAPPRAEIVLTGRGKAWLARRNYERAHADFTAALKTNEKYANALSGRAFAQFCRGNFDAAAEDFRNERRFRKDAESAVDLLIAVRRGGHDAGAELADAVGDYGASRGVPPGVALFSGTLTPEQTIQASDDRDPRRKRERICELSFAVGEWYVLKPDRVLAERYLAMARDNCDPSHPEFAAAGAELERLK